MSDIAIEVADQQAIVQLEDLGKNFDGIMSKRQGLDGVALSTVIMTLTPIVIHGVVKIVRAQQEAKKHVRVIVDGVEIRGVSEETLLKILSSTKSQGVEK